MQLLDVWIQVTFLPVGNHSQNSANTPLNPLFFSNTSNINAQIVIKYAYAKKNRETPKTRKYMRIIISSYFIAWDTYF